jgi:hypothetical protein
MKANVRRFKSLAIGLKELERFIRDGRHMYTGRPFKGLDGMRSREAVANWLMCAAISFERGQPYCFTSDPLGGDGIIYDTVAEKDWPTEHIFVPHAGPKETRDIDTLILDAVRAKETKGGAAYATGKTLIVFLDAGLGEWKPNVVARKLPVSAEVILAQLAEVKVDHLVEDGGFGTAHADSGADRGDTSVEASRQRDSRDRSRAWSVEDYRATVFEGPEAQTLRAA